MSPRTSPASSSAQGVQQASLPTGIVVALALHAMVAASIIFAWTHAMSTLGEVHEIVPVDLVTIADKTNVRAAATEKPKEPPKEEEIQPPTPERAQVTPSAPPEQEAAPEADDAAQDKVLPKPPPPEVKPTEKPQPEKKKDSFDIDKMMAFLDKRAPAATSAPNARVAPKSVRGIGQQDAATADLASALASQVAPCWHVDAGALNAGQMVVQFQLSLNRDGTFSEMPQLITNTGGNPLLRAAAEKARNAIYACQPYKLPADRYNQWQDIVFTFDPKDFVGQ